MCTRILWNDNAYAVFAARTMDWPETTQPVLTLFPRGAHHNGGAFAGETAVSDNALEWSSRYGSLVTTVYGHGAADGINERGLGAHLLAFNAADFGPRDATKPGIHAGLWAQFVLDNAADVEEALHLLEHVQFVMVTYRGFPAAVHLAIEDAEGDSAIIEYIEGKLVVHHGREFTIMTNDPAYQQQLDLLAEQDFSHPSRDMPLPGNVNPIDRFQRAAYYRAMLPEPIAERDGIASILSVARNVSVPFGAPYHPYGIYNTEYRTAANLNARHYYIELSNGPSVTWTLFNELDVSEGAPVLQLDPDDIELAGNVTGRYVAAPAPY